MSWDKILTEMLEGLLFVLPEKANLLEIWEPNKNTFLVQNIALKVYTVLISKKSSPVIF